MNIKYYVKFATGNFIVSSSYTSKYTIIFSRAYELTLRGKTATRVVNIYPVLIGSATINKLLIHTDDHVSTCLKYIWSGTTGNVIPVFWRDKMKLKRTSKDILLYDLVVHFRYSILFSLAIIIIKNWSNYENPIRALAFLYFFSFYILKV